MGRIGALDPLTVYKRGLHDRRTLTPDERLVYLLMELETYMDMEGWDEFFTTDLLQHLPEMKAGLAAAGDNASLAVLEDYEAHLRQRGVALDADAISKFLSERPDEYYESCPDWRNRYSEITAQRWAKIDALLSHGGSTKA